MRLIYLSIDDVNRSLVRGWGDRHGFVVVCPRDLDHAAAEPGDIVVVDLDHLPAGRLEGTITRLRAAVASHRVGVHGYGANESDWNRRGLEARPHLGPELLQALASAPDPLSSELSNMNQGDRSWVSLA